MVGSRLTDITRARNRDKSRLQVRFIIFSSLLLHARGFQGAPGLPVSQGQRAVQSNYSTQLGIMAMSFTSKSVPFTSRGQIGLAAAARR